MNKIEQECIILNSAWDMINGMVNWAMWVKFDRPDPSNLMPSTMAHRTLFNIILGDFLSQLKAFRGEPIPLGLRAAPSNASPSNLTYLFYLRQVCDEPSFAGNILPLRKAVEDFATWLEGEFVAPDVNLPDIDVVADIRVNRYRYIKICGDIAKHNLARLSTNVGHIRALLEASGHPISEQDGYLVVANFYEWFHVDIFAYHSGQIAESLNNIRWAMYDYLLPEFARAYTPTTVISGAQMYRYEYPEGCEQPIAKAMFWDLMNRMRSGPWVHRFAIPDLFKSHY